MGPSGSGKTTLLNVLAGRARSNGKLIVESDVRLNNFAVDPTNIEVRNKIAFVAQDDSLQVTSTPREAILFSARLRLPKHTTESDLESLTDQMLSELGLQDCADTIVGGALIKGISGGERKRTSVGVELAARPALVFLDEPTSGKSIWRLVEDEGIDKMWSNELIKSTTAFTINQHQVLTASMQSSFATSFAR